jgi:hypothetical protein
LINTASPLLQSHPRKRRREMNRGGVGFQRNARKLVTRQFRSVGRGDAQTRFLGKVLLMIMETPLNGHEHLSS